MSGRWFTSNAGLRDPYPVADTAAARWTARWVAFWFQEVPPHLYALLRIGLGCHGLLLLLGLGDLQEFWWPGGLERIAEDGFRSRVIELGLGGVVGTIVYGGSVLVTIAMVIGYRSSLAVPLVFAFSLLQASWNTLPLSAAAEAYRSFVFCLMWIDTGDVWSIESWYARSRTQETPRQPANQPIWPLRLIQFQLALIYLNSGLWKLLNVAWRDGSALYYVVSGNEFRRFALSVPPDLDWIWTIGTYATLGWELTFWLLVLHPWSRRVGLVFGVITHLSMWALLEVGTFSFVMLAAYLAFLDPTWVTHRFARVSRRM